MNTFEGEVLHEQLFINHVLWYVKHVFLVHVLEPSLESGVVLEAVVVLVTSRTKDWRPETRDLSRDVPGFLVGVHVAERALFLGLGVKTCRHVNVVIMWLLRMTCASVHLSLRHFTLF